MSEVKIKILIEKKCIKLKYTRNLILKYPILIRLISNDQKTD